MTNILKKIIEKKVDRVKGYKKKYSTSEIFQNIKNNNNYINFKDKLKKRDTVGDLSIIAEIKKASPSAGTLIQNFNHLDIAKSYIENGAPFLSILTEEDFFLGKLEFIRDIKKIHQIPILCKDFFIDPYQIPLVKSFGADCILIILSAVDKKLSDDLYQAANELNISTLVEVHSTKEAEMALNYENAIIGMNNRNLDTLNVSLNTTIELSRILDSHKNPLVSESGFHSVDDIETIIENVGIYNFLIGESLLKSRDIGLKLKELSQISL
jgi:indole-3-glycerol phosphate synthase